MHWLTSRFLIDLRAPKVMGIVNVTPDSFADGGQHAQARAAMDHCDRLLAQGADILDIGGESTRPGALPTDATEQLARIVPVVRHAVTLGSPVSVDTSDATVIRAVLDLGADVINDVRALQRPNALDAFAGHPRAGVCLMHMRGEPQTMQADPRYADVLAEVAAFLAERAARVRAGGVSAERIVLDPGFGFGKTLEHNVELARRQRELRRLGYPLLVGWSRKGTLGRLTGREVHERTAASVAAALAAVSQGAAIVRVHDVAATVDALKVWRALTPEPTP